VTKSRRRKWRPASISRLIRSLPTSTDTVVVMTDTGEGYLKAMGNRAGEHALACELVGTQLARWLGLSTFDFHLIQVTEANEIPFAKGGQAKPGPAFITRTEPGEPWGGKKRELKRLINPQDVSLLVVFDTWTLNCDRHSFKDGGRVRINRNNVFLSEEAPRGRLLLKAMDHTHCFTCGKELSPPIAHIDRTKDPRIFGLFPEFRPFLDREVVRRTAERLGALTRETVEQMVQGIPPEWDVKQSARKALADLILARASYVADSIMNSLWPQGDLPFPDGAGDKS
jgi:hypothetical protein